MKYPLISISLSLILWVNTNAQVNEVTLEQVQTFGSQSLDVSDSVVAGGDTFSRIESMAVTDRYLFVLDSDFKKISVFNKNNGQFIRNLMGGYGRGPGEFILPLSLSITPEQEIAVYDYQNRKVDLFDFSGEHLDQIGVLLPTRSIAVTHDRYWVASMGTKASFAYSFQKENDPVSYSDFERYIEITDEDLEYDRDGVVSHIANSNDFNDLYVATHRPSTWYSINGNSVTKHGIEAYPEMKAVRNRFGRYNPINKTKGICQMNNEFVVVLWSHWPTENVDDRYVALDFYRKDGTYLAQKQFEMRVVNINIACDGEANELYLFHYFPYPRVLKYQVTFEQELR